MQVDLLPLLRELPVPLDSVRCRTLSRVSGAASCRDKEMVQVKIFRHYRTNLAKWISAIHLELLPSKTLTVQLLVLVMIVTGSTQVATRALREPGEA